MVSAELPDNWQELLADYVLGNLSEDEVLRVERLLNDHPNLLQELEALQDAFNGFSEVVPSRQLPERLREKIHRAAQRSLDVAKSTRPEPRRRFRLAASLRGVGTIAGAAGIAATIFLGSRVAWLNDQLQQANAQIETLERDLHQANLQAQKIRPVLDTLQEPGTLIYSLQGSDRANAASGSLVMSTQTNQVMILVQNLPELPTGQIYRLWAKIPSATTLTYCGQFNTNANGFVQLKPSTNICGANPTQMLITIDALSDPTTKGGPVMMHSRT